jgi:hypothetical protein
MRLVQADITSPIFQQEEIECQQAVFNRGTLERIYGSRLSSYWGVERQPLMMRGLS